jgi:two-component system cell cycle response regulator DivK
MRQPSVIASRPVGRRIRPRHYQLLTPAAEDRRATRALHRSPRPPTPGGRHPHLPRGCRGMNSDASNPDPNGACSAPRKILIVEDNILNMKLFNDVLVAHGYETLQSRDGPEALALARRYRPDLILMDIQLPEVSGLEVTRWLKQDAELKAIPVVAITAFAMKGDEQKIRDGGCEGYIAKPISIASFLRTVEGFLA